MILIVHQYIGWDYTLAGLHTKSKILWKHKVRSNFCNQERDKMRNQVRAIKLVSVISLSISCSRCFKLYY